MFEEEGEIDCSYHIVYPWGDRAKLIVVEISLATSYEINNYDAASSKKYATLDLAEKRAKELASDHGLEYVNDRARPALLE